MGVIETGPNLSPSDISNDVPMTADRSTKIITEHAAYQGDLQTRRKNYVSGALKNDSFIYVSKAITASGVAIFYLTDDGTSTGNAIFTNIYSDSIAVVAYGSAANYQPFNPVIAASNKSITINLNQATSVLLGAIQLVSAANGVDCRLYVMGD